MILEPNPAFVAFHFGSSVLRFTQINRSNSHAGNRFLDSLNPVPILSLLTEQSLAYFKVRDSYLAIHKEIEYRILGRCSKPTFFLTQEIKILLA
jgi:hypothetical protein